MGSEDNNKGDEIMLLYHGSPVIVKKPEIRTAKSETCDFIISGNDRGVAGFYCCLSERETSFV